MENTVKLDPNSKAPRVAGLLALVTAGIYFYYGVVYGGKIVVPTMIVAAAYVFVSILLLAFVKNRIKLLILPLVILVCMNIYEIVTYWSPLLRSLDYFPRGFELSFSYISNITASIFLIIGFFILILTLIGKINGVRIAAVFFTIVIFLKVSYFLVMTLFIGGFPISLLIRTTILQLLPAITFFVFALAFPRPANANSEAGISKSTTLNKQIGLSVALSILTFGIYMIYWVFCIAKEIKALKSDHSSVVGEVVCVFLVPFYVIYWAYTRSASIEQMAKEKNIDAPISSVANLVLSIFGFMIIVIALIQNSLNVLSVSTSNEDS